MWTPRLGRLGGGVKRWSPVVIEWIDAHGGDNGWTDPGELKHRPRKMVTAGLLFKNDEHGVTVVLSRDTDSGAIGGYIFIPAVNISTVRPIGGDE